MELASVGHSNRPAGELLALLQEAGIRCVADVRRFPVSRRHPQHSRARLESALRAAGIAYVFLGDALGGRREPSAASDPATNGAWRDPGLRAFADTLDSPETAGGLAERDWRSCHRQIIADALLARGHRVLHLVRPGERELHALHPAARVVGGRLSYPTLV